MAGGKAIELLVADPLKMAFRDLNDLGNAQRLQTLAHGELLWIEDLGWIAYDTRRWSAEDGELRANQLAHEVARHIDDEAAALNEIAGDAEALERSFGWRVPVKVAEDRVIALRKHAVASGDASRTAAMLKQARTLLTARIDDFDRDPLALNLQNGTLRFFEKKGGGWGARLCPHDPDDRLMQIANFAYEPKADCPQWVERMRLIQPGKDQRALLQQLYGYCLTGLTSEQKWFIFQGRGGDGKSLTNTVIAEEMGDYYRHAGVETFLQGPQRGGSDHSADLERLKGDIRLVVCDEPGPSAVWNASRLKQWTGSKVTARGVGARRTVEFYPRGKLIVEVNPLPKVPSDDDGFWRRCRPIPWKYQFDKKGIASEPFDLLVSRLRREESSGILNWMIAGALKWLETRRLPEAADSAELLGNYRLASSSFGEWLDDRADIDDPSALTASGILYQDFKAWCERAGVDKVPTQASFGRSMTNRQHLEKKDRRGNRFRRGIRLKPDWQEQGLGAAGSGDEQDVGVGGRASAQRSSGPIGPQEDVDDAPFG